jgi:ferredoxin--NADP+ reductase
MADWVTGKVTKIQFWTDALFSLTPCSRPPV